MSGEHEFDLLCIGSGPAGQRAAVQAAKLRKRVAIIEYQMEVGGTCLHTGTIPSKTFREAVLSQNLLSEADLVAIDQRARDAVADAVKFAEESPPPEPAECLEDVYVSY